MRHNHDNNAGRITCRQTELTLPKCPHIALYSTHTLTHLQLFTFLPTLNINDFYLTQKILLELFESSRAGPKCTNTPFYFHSGALNIRQDSKSTTIFYPHIYWSDLFAMFFAVVVVFVFLLCVTCPPPPPPTTPPHRGRRCSSPRSAEQQQGTVTVCPAWSQRRLSAISQALLTTIWMEDNLFLNS